MLYIISSTNVHPHFLPGMASIINGNSFLDLGRNTKVCM